MACPLLRNAQKLAPRLGEEQNSAPLPLPQKNNRDSYGLLTHISLTMRKARRRVKDKENTSTDKERAEFLTKYAAQNQQ